MEKTKPLYADLMAKYIFGTEENLIYIAHLLELFFKLKPGTLANATIRNSVHLSRETINKKGFEMNIIVETPASEVINIEFYSKYNNNNLNAEERDSLNEKAVQINFVKNNLMPNTGKVTYDYIVINKNNLQAIDPDIIRLFIVDLDQEINQDYNNDELMRWIKLIGAETDEEMQEIVKGNAMMEEVYEKMKEFSQEEWVNDYFNKERLVKSEHNSELREQKEKMIENMLKDNISLENISKYTNMPLNAIKDIKKKIEAQK